MAEHSGGQRGTRVVVVALGQHWLGETMPWAVVASVEEREREREEMLEDSCCRDQEWLR